MSDWPTTVRGIVAILTWMSTVFCLVVFVPNPAKVFVVVIYLVGTQITIDLFKEGVMPDTSNKHQRLYREALKAVEELFSDTTVSQQKTRETLEDLKDDIETKLSSLPHDIEA